MKNLVLYIFFGFLFFFTSCGTPSPGSYAWGKKYSNSGMSANRSSQCGIKKTKRPKGMQVKYTDAKKSKKKKK